MTDFECILEGGPFDGQTVKGSQVEVCGLESVVTIGDTTALYDVVDAPDYPLAADARSWRMRFKRLAPDLSIVRAIGAADVLLAKEGFRDMSLCSLAASVGILIFAAAHAQDRVSADKYLARALIHAETVHLRTPVTPVGGPLHDGAPGFDESDRLARVSWAVKNWAANLPEWRQVDKRSLAKMALKDLA